MEQVPVPHTWKRDDDNLMWLKNWDYLIGCNFKVRIVNSSIKYPLDPRASCYEQEKWIAKIPWIDIKIIYKKGK